MIRAGLLLIFSLFWAGLCLAQTFNYPIVAIKAPRYGNSTPTSWQEVDYAAAIEPGQDLVLINPNGSEETLVSCQSSGCAVVDPCVSFDGQNVYYSFYPDVRPQAINNQRGLPYQGADIYRMNLSSRQITRLTHQEFTPNSGVANWSSTALGSGESNRYRLGYGILNLGACPIPGPASSPERIIFTSNRNGFVPARGFTNPNLQIFIMDYDGTNVRQVGHLNLGSAMHPTVLRDGRVMFSSSEAQGVRDERVWGLWAIKPDGRSFEPLMSAFMQGLEATALHFQTQLSNGDIAVTEYYNLNNNGFGTILAFPSQKPLNQPAFGSPDGSHSSNPQIQAGRWFFNVGHPSHLQPRYNSYPFSPFGLYTLTPFSHGRDEAASRALNSQYAGKVTHPSGAPGNDLLLIWSPGPANDLDRPEQTPRVQGGIYLLNAGVPVDDPADLLLIKSNSSFNYQQPRAVSSYLDIYGADRPSYIPYLPEGASPFGLIGTASFYNRNTTPGDGVAAFGGLDPFNTDENSASSNWVIQGADAGLYTNSDIYAVRILAMEPSSHLSYGPDGYEHTRAFKSFASERLRILGEFPLRKFNQSGEQPLDGDGNPDTSFLARIPADVPFTFQTLDKDGLLLNMSQTWHQLRPGERRFDCGGCHAHANLATDFTKTAAARADYQAFDAVNSLSLLSKDGAGKTIVSTYSAAARLARMDVEYLRDIKPILQRSCVGCHTSAGGQTPAAELDLGNTSLSNGYERSYLCLTSDDDADCGYKPVVASQTWRQTNASRWVRKFQSRRSLLIWKIFGRRLDGWSNASHPTESVPGNAASLPSGANRNLADLDYTGNIMPPTGSAYAALSEDEKIMFARWIDLGAPSNKSGSDASLSGWFVDELRPTLNISWPKSEIVKSLNKIEFVAHDYYAGLDLSSLRVTANFPVNGQSAGSDLSSQFNEITQGVYRLNLNEPLTTLSAGRIDLSIKDKIGNISTQQSLFSVDAEQGVTEEEPGGDIPGGTLRKPRIISKLKLKIRFGKKLTYRIKATHTESIDGPIIYKVKKLARGLKLRKNGRIIGKPKRSGRFRISLWVQNSSGISDQAKLVLRVLS